MSKKNKSKNVKAQKDATTKAYQASIAAKKAAEKKAPEKKEPVAVEAPKVVVDPPVDKKADPLDAAFEAQYAPKAALAPEKESVAPVEEVANSSIDAWFASQRRELASISGRMDGSPLPTAAPRSVSTPESTKEWATSQKTLGRALLEASAVTKKKAPPKQEQSTTEAGFDLWLERRRAELHGLQDSLEESTPAAMAPEEWRLKLDAASNQALASWQSTLEETVVAPQQLTESDRKSAESVKELERSLAKMCDATASHHDVMRQNDTAIEHSQFSRLNNLTTHMADRIYSVA